jgi:hypothetical protein
MALAKGSPAVDAADGTVTLISDQRGQERPVGQGYDVGSFELCLEGPLDNPCIIFNGFKDTDPTLSMQVSPAGAGTTTPAVGDHKETAGTIVVIEAHPDSTHRFLSWTGSVTNPSSPLTTVVMSGDQQVTANFEPLPDFTLSSISPLSIVVGSSGSTPVTVNANATFNQSVVLSTLGPPVGSTGTFNPASVTPAFGASAGSQLTLALGPGVLPGPYSFNVVGTSGTLVHSTPVSLTVVVSPAGVAQVISTLGPGCIDSAGVANAFTAKLAQAQAALNAGDYQTAINLLTALLHQLQAQAGKHLHTQCTDSNGNTIYPVQLLTEEVTDILKSLGVNLKADPIMGTLVNSSNVEVVGATISIMSSSRTIIAATTDATGFYVFPNITTLKLGTYYTVKVTLPKGYKLSTPSSQVFKWSATTVSLPNFILR